MAQTNYTPIQLYYSSTASAVPVNTNLASGELAINITDGLLFYKDNAGTVQKIGYKLTPTTAGGTGLTSFTNGGIVYASSTSALATNSALTFDGTNLGVGTSSPTQKLDVNGAIAISGTKFLSKISGANYWWNGATATYWVDSAGNTVQMALDASGNLGIGTSSPGQPLHVSKNQNASTWAYVSNTTAGTGSAAGFLFASDVVTGAIQAVSSLNTGLGNNNSLWIRTTGAYPITLGTNSTVQMTLDSSGNLGIGTSSPAYKLQVANNGNFNTTVNVSNTTAGTSSYARFLSISDGGNASFGMTSTTYTDVASSADALLINASGASGGIVFAHDGVSKMLLDSSGNLGLGVTPSGWDSRTAFQNGAASMASTSANRSVAEFSANSYLSSGGIFRYIYTANASLYQQVTGEHRFFTASSGTAGNAISFTQAMTLDASSNLGIGTTSPAALKRLHVANVAAGSGMRVSGPTSDNNWAGGIEFYSDNATTTTSNILVSSGGMQFGYGGSERMRIDSSGNLLVGGTTSYGGKIQAISSYIRVANGTSSQNVGFVSSDQAGNEWHFGRSNVNGYFYVVRQTGTGMYMDTNSWVATSDLRAKENIVSLESSIAKILALNPVRFRFKNDGMEDVGFIAQEMYEHIPDAVHKPEDKEAMMGISKEKIIPFLVKAIQEQQALITQLTARITALEGA